MIILIYLIFSYLIGSIPFGLLITKIAGIKDIRNIGSGNIGATNVLRAAGKKLGALTLVLDAAKGMLVFLIGKKIFISESDFIYFASALSVIGHIFSPWLGFKGGKGVATFVGIIFATNIYMGLVFAFIWIFVFYLCQIVSLASIIASIILPIFTLLVFEWKITLLYFFLSFLVIISHYQNLKRLLQGKESKIDITSKKHEKIKK